MPPLNIAMHLFEAVGEQGVEWMLVQARILHASRLQRGKRATLVFELTTDFDFNSLEYADLFERADATAFQHPIWLDRVFKQLAGAANRSPAILVGRRARDRRLMFVLPMIRRGLGPFSILDTADLEVGDYNVPVIDRVVASDPAALEQIRSRLRGLRLVRMRKVRDGAIGASLCETSAQISPMDFRAHEVELTAPLAGWQSHLLKPEFARLLRSKRKRLSAKGAVALEEVSEPERIRAAFDSLLEFRQDRWANDLLRDPTHFAFYLDVAVAGAAEGFARTYVLSVNGHVLSVLFGIHHRGRFCFLLLGFNQQRFRNHSTGLLTLESAIEDCIRRGDHVFDLTIGDEAYKQNFGTRTVAMSVLWFGKRPWTQLAPKVLAAARKARSLVRKHQRLRSPGK